MTEAEIRAEGRGEAAPAAFAALLVLIALALVSRARQWELLGLPWWIWLVVGIPAFLLTIDLSLTRRGKGLVQSRRAALVLLGLLVLGNLSALTILVAGLVTENTSDLTGGELLLTASAIYTTNVIVFGVLFWELEARWSGGSEALSGHVRLTTFSLPRTRTRRLAPEGWRPQVWDYLYVSLTNSIAFSPTDAMPLSRRAKALMGLGSTIAAVTVLLVAARAVNVLGA